ncbi:hypothetical protein F6R98_06140 [Candidatus Methylospira mobilis]|uniref:Uncharacterized protein n=1 Tax=Candidatus Methylospira mobilis TaxID=1808979 RepID=A0A5Q0BJC5_9GAMM|nr:hypothetical protein [Candidatus Methylospira mobilis]QFY42258.1 hypothetical protein F6R98_06140 [Candidatus Methylospira mobilis]
MRTHHELDERSLALHRLIADKIRQYPVLFDRAKETLARRRKIVCVSSHSPVCRYLSLADIARSRSG